MATAKSKPRKKAASAKKAPAAAAPKAAVQQPVVNDLTPAARIAEKSRTNMLFFWVLMGVVVALWGFTFIFRMNYIEGLK